MLLYTNDWKDSNQFKLVTNVMDVCVDHEALIYSSTYGTGKVNSRFSYGSRYDTSVFELAMG